MKHACVATDMSTTNLIKEIKWLDDNTKQLCGDVLWDIIAFMENPYIVLLGTWKTGLEHRILKKNGAHLYLLHI